MSLILIPPVRPWRGFRGVDSYGSGVFGASRDGGSRGHMGRDLITVPGDAILAPFDAKIARSGWAYPDGEMTLLVLEGVNEYKGWGSRILYIKPTINAGAIVNAGDQIGTAQDLTAYYRKTHPDHVGDITNHVHLELTVPVDPTMYLPDHLSPDATA